MTSAEHAVQPAHRSGTFNIGGDLNVYRLGFGAMRLTGKGVWGEPTDRKEAIAVLHRALELGVTMIDTADSYGPAVSEQLIAEALYPYPKNLVIATKGGFERPGPEQWIVNGNPGYLRSACETSLRRLKLEQIDLYQLHRIDPRVPIADQIGVLIDLHKEGKIRHIGLSEVSVMEIEEVRRMTAIASVQNKYNLFERNSERVLEYCTRENIAFIPWYPLAAGNITESMSIFKRISDKFHARPAQIALAWLLKKSPVVLPIPGTSSVKHLEENVAAALIELDEQTMKELEQFGA
ncbi:aldo/keto reductase [Legionella fallonii]|uniref:Pyridoxine 4-dehydrogenase n=1 Tax=Legionella fallonii LLAP-10 TaxID=1212491 RepID=A0A098G5T7_9GAMM|nr:aldo/keto reductase [Legionella fallonii]CEG56860.1 Pyridoxine 4-dehydrogenase [Legionella fallonii LLAP-10]